MIDLLITMKVPFRTKIRLTSSTSIFQSFTYLKSTQGRYITTSDGEVSEKYVDCLGELMNITEVVRS